MSRTTTVQEQARWAEHVANAERMGFPNMDSYFHSLDEVRRERMAEERREEREAEQEEADADTDD